MRDNQKRFSLYAMLPHPHTAAKWGWAWISRRIYILFWSHFTIFSPKLPNLHFFFIYSFIRRQKLFFNNSWQISCYYFFILLGINGLFRSFTLCPKQPLLQICMRYQLFFSTFQMLSEKSKELCRSYIGNTNTVQYL